MKKSRLVMIGNGMAGVRTLEELLKIAPDLYDITVFGAEPHPNYNRILLSPVLAGEQTLDEIVLNDWAWYRENGITLHAGWKVSRVDRVRRVVHAENAAGETMSAEYDRLLLATGSNPFILPIPGKDLEGVIAYRDIADTNAMIEASEKYQRAVVIGGGLLGLEAANGLMKRGMQVSVIHVMPTLMERQLDEVAGKLLQKSLEERGLRFFMGGQTQALIGDQDGGKAGRVMALQFKDGTEIPTDLVVMAVGIRPNTELAEAMRLHVNRGVVVSDTMQTVTDARIYSVGECAAHRGIAYGLVAPLFEQGKVAANHLAMFGIGRYTGSLTSTKLKVTGIDLFSAGNFQGGEGTEEIVMSDPFGGVYKKLVIKDDKLVGACLYGDTVDGSWYFKLLRDGRSVHDLRDKLMFGESNLGEGGHEGHNKAAAMADTDEVCGCNGVTKGTICKTIKEKGLFTLGRGAQAHQGQRQLRLLHRSGGAAADGHRGRRLLGHAQDEAHVRLYRPRPSGGARRDQVLQAAEHRRRVQVHGVEDAQRLRQLPPGRQLLPAQHLAEGSEGRSTKPLHQRTQPRQHPEGWHVLGDPAHVGRRDHGR
jgi:nitrite reductase (NADH) large subunit